MAEVYNLVQPLRCDCGTGTSVTLRDVDRFHYDRAYAEDELTHQLRLDCWGLIGPTRRLSDLPDRCTRAAVC